MDANTKDILDAVNFIKDNMATKDDIAELAERIDGIDNKISGFKNRIDQEVDKRKVLEVKVARLEEKVGV